VKKSHTIVTAAAGAAIILFGGVAAVQQQASPELNVDSLAAQLGLSNDVKAQIAPQVDQLNALLAQREQIRRQHADLRTRLGSVRNEIAQALTPEQRQGFGWALRRAWGNGQAGYGRGMRAGAMGPAQMGYGRHMMGSRMGNGRGMGAGAMRGSGRMGPRGRMMGGAGPGMGAGYGQGWANCPYAQQSEAAQDSTGS